MGEVVGYSWYTHTGNSKNKETWHIFISHECFKCYLFMPLSVYN